jgi:hypothetical protein
VEKERGGDSPVAGTLRHAREVNGGGQEEKSEYFQAGRSHDRLTEKGRKYREDLVSNTNKCE